MHPLKKVSNTSVGSGFGGCSPGTKTGTRVHSDVHPERKPERGYVRMFPERKPERGHIRQTDLLRNRHFVSSRYCLASACHHAHWQRLLPRKFKIELQSQIVELARSWRTSFGMHALNRNRYHDGCAPPTSRYEDPNLTPNTRTAMDNSGGKFFVVSGWSGLFALEVLL